MLTRDKQWQYILFRKMLEFHKTYYHPSNSYIYLYGNMDVEENLAFIDEEYLSKFDYLYVDSEIGDQKAFESTRRVEEADIKEIIDEEYEQREQEYLNYMRLITEQYSKCLDDTREAQLS